MENIFKDSKAYRLLVDHFGFERAGYLLWNETCFPTVPSDSEELLRQAKRLVTKDKEARARAEVDAKGWARKFTQEEISREQAKQAQREAREDVEYEELASLFGKKGPPVLSDAVVVETRLKNDLALALRDSANSDWNLMIVEVCRLRNMSDSLKKTFVVAKDVLRVEHYKRLKDVVVTRAERDSVYPVGSDHDINAYNDEIKKTLNYYGIMHTMYYDNVFVWGCDVLKFLKYLDELSSSGLKQQDNRKLPLLLPRGI